MDDADIAAARDEALLERALKSNNLQAPEVKATGICLNCGEPLADGARWCDKYCLEDWEARRARGQP